MRIATKATIANSSGVKSRTSASISWGRNTGRKSQAVTGMIPERTGSTYVYMLFCGKEI